MWWCVLILVLAGLFLSHLFLEFQSDQALLHIPQLIVFFPVLQVHPYIPRCLVQRIPDIHCDGRIIRQLTDHGLDLFDIFRTKNDKIK